MKRCAKCGTVKDLVEFARNRSATDGLQSYCKECVAPISAYYYRRRQAQLGKVVRERVDVPAGHKRCPNCERILPFAEWHRNRATSDGFADWCKSCRNARSKEQHLQRKFGITSVERDAMLEAQGGLCAICRSDKPTHTDHNHATGELRGLLCTGCNLGLGQFKDDPQRLIAAVRYLMRHGAPKKGAAAVMDISHRTGPSPLEANVRWHLAS